MNKGLAGLLKYAMPSLKLPKTYISLSQRMAGHMRSKFYNKQKYGPKKIDLLKIWLLIKNQHFCPILVKLDGNESTKTEYHYDNWTIIENSLLLANISASLIFFGTCFH